MRLLHRHDVLHLGVQVGLGEFQDESRSDAKNFSTYDAQKLAEMVTTGMRLRDDALMTEFEETDRHFLSRRRQIAPPTRSSRAAGSSIGQGRSTDEHLESVMHCSPGGIGAGQIHREVWDYEVSEYCKRDASTAALSNQRQIGLFQQHEQNPIGFPSVAS